MARTEVDGDQITDGSVQRKDLDTTTMGESVITKVVAGTGISISSSGIDEGTGDVTLDVDVPDFGSYQAHKTKVSYETVSGGTFTEYDSLVFNVSNATNVFRLNCDFLWGHNSASNDIRVRVYLDGSQLGEEMRIEPKDQGGDQRIQNNLLNYVRNLSLGNHTLTLAHRPATTNRVSRMYRSILEVWRVA